MVDIGWSLEKGKFTWMFINSIWKILTILYKPFFKLYFLLLFPIAFLPLASKDHFFIEGRQRERINI